jgi:hypothetical protein
MIFHNKHNSIVDRQSVRCGTGLDVAEGASHLEGRHTNTEVPNHLSLSPNNEVVSLSVTGAQCRDLAEYPLLVSEDEL